MTASARLLGLFGVVLFIFVTGCQSSGGGGGGTIAVNPDSDAVRAWRQMRSQASAASVGAGIAGVFDRTAGAGVGIAANLLREAQYEAERQADRAMESDLPVQAMNEMIDEMATWLARELAEHERIKAAPTQVVLAFAGNKFEGGRPAGRDLQEVMDAIEGRLATSEPITDNFVILSSTVSDADKALQSINEGDYSMFRDPLQRDLVDTTAAVAYHPDLIYLVSGELYSRQDRTQYAISIRFVTSFLHVRSRENLLTREFERTYVWHPRQKEWQVQHIAAAP
ncbi:MAG: hypothetical protein JJU36_05485 [Phycisphaeraceae bacterium]|nr:hypothetical protein [Phycisphaeraceae bacterium]